MPNITMLDIDQLKESKLRPLVNKCLRHKAPDPTAAERVRVLMTGVPMAHGSERVLDLIEGNGGLVVAMENCTGLKPILEDVEFCRRGAPGRFRPHSLLSTHRAVNSHPSLHAPDRRRRDATQLGVGRDQRGGHQTLGQIAADAPEHPSGTDGMRGALFRAPSPPSPAPSCPWGPSAA